MRHILAALILLALALPARAQTTITVTPDLATTADLDAAVAAAAAADTKAQQALDGTTVLGSNQTAIQSAIADLEARATALEADNASLRTLLENLAANGIQTVATRHGLVQENNVPDPFEVLCVTTVDTPVRCDPRSETYDVEGDELFWDNGVCANGTLAPVADQPTYTPNPGFSGTDDCTADVSDDGGFAVETIVTITVNP